MDDDRYFSGPRWHWVLMLSSIALFVAFPFVGMQYLMAYPPHLPDISQVRGTGGGIVVVVE
jgi:hypothetical protein